MLKTKEFHMGGLDLLLTLGAKETFKIEKKLEKSIIAILMDGDKQKLPPVNELLIIIHGCNQKHGVKEKDILEAYYRYVDGGEGTTLDLLELVMELIGNSGFSQATKEAESVEAMEEEAVL